MKRIFTALCLLLLLALQAGASTSATAILFDTSRSIPPQDFKKAQELIGQMVASGGADDQFLLYAFGNDLRKISADEVPSLSPTQSYTMLFDAAYDVAQELDRTKADRKSIVIISDGQDTKSATILEDTAAYVNQRGIAVYGIGVGKVQRKTLERIARLTGGAFYPIAEPDLAATFRQAQASQKLVETTPIAQAAPASPAGQATATPSPAPSQKQVPDGVTITPAPPQQEGAGSRNLIWIAGAAGALALFLGIGWIVVRSLRKPERACPTCGRILESYQTVCPSCPADARLRTTPRSPDSTQEIGTPEEEPDLIPVELLEKKPVTEEMLSKTFVLMETPMLVIRKGRNIGQTYSLNRVSDVSIGRSRVNEIKLEDVTVSGQHCRIHPENGKHVLYDLGSTNGTFVNDKRVSKLVLTEGDIIKIGETQFLYKLDLQRN